MFRGGRGGPGWRGGDGPPPFRGRDGPPRGGRGFRGAGGGSFAPHPDFGGQSGFGPPRGFSPRSNGGFGPRPDGFGPRPDGFAPRGRGFVPRGRGHGPLGGPSNDFPNNSREQQQDYPPQGRDDYHNSVDHNRDPGFNRGGPPNRGFFRGRGFNNSPFRDSPTRFTGFAADETQSYVMSSNNPWNRKEEPHLEAPIAQDESRPGPSRGRSGPSPARSRSGPSPARSIQKSRDEPLPRGLEPVAAAPKAQKQTKPRQPALPNEDEPIYDDSLVILDWYNSDLNLLINSKDYCSAKAMSHEGFGLMWAGARATYGATRGRACFEVRVDNNCSTEHLESEPTPNVLRVGWSTQDASMQLGEEPFSYGYGGTGMKAVGCRFESFGLPFGVGDVVGSFVDFTCDPIQIVYTLNGKSLGAAFFIKKTELGGKALYPHVLTKNQDFTVNFGQLPAPLGILLPNYPPIGQLDVDDGLIRGSLPPSSRSDCEVLLMIGLPGAGKSTWSLKYCKDNPEKRYNVLGTNNLLERMKVQGLPRKRNYHGRWDTLISKCTKCFDDLLKIATKRRRNYILDQTNVFPTARGRKLRDFGGFTCRAVVVIPNDLEFKRRVAAREAAEGKEVPDEAVLNMKANFVLPDIEETYFHEVLYAEMSPIEAQTLVYQYNAEAAQRRVSMTNAVSGFVKRNKDKRQMVGDFEVIGKKLNLDGTIEVPPGPSQIPMKREEHHDVKPSRKRSRSVSRDRSKRRRSRSHDRRRSRSREPRRSRWGSHGRDGPDQSPQANGGPPPGFQPPMGGSNVGGPSPWGNEVGAPQGQHPPSVPIRDGPGNRFPPSRPNLEPSQWGQDPAGPGQFNRNPRSYESFNQGGGPRQGPNPNWRDSPTVGPGGQFQPPVDNGPRGGQFQPPIIQREQYDQRGDQRGQFQPQQNQRDQYRPPPPAFEGQQRERSFEPNRMPSDGRQFPGPNWENQNGSHPSGQFPAARQWQSDNSMDPGNPRARSHNQEMGNTQPPGGAYGRDPAFREHGRQPPNNPGPPGGQFQDRNREDSRVHSAQAPEQDSRFPSFPNNPRNRPGENEFPGRAPPPRTGPSESRQPPPGTNQFRPQPPMHGHFHQGDGAQASAHGGQFDQSRPTGANFHSGQNSSGTMGSSFPGSNPNQMPGAFPGNAGPNFQGGPPEPNNRWSGPNGGCNNWNGPGPPMGPNTSQTGPHNNQMNPQNGPNMNPGPDGGPGSRDAPPDYNALLQYLQFYQKQMGGDGKPGGGAQG